MAPDPIPVFPSYAGGRDSLISPFIYKGLRSQHPQADRVQQLGSGALNPFDLIARIYSKGVEQ